jgi:hypothetical protein
MDPAELLAPIAETDPAILAALAGVMLVGGFVKGAVGFALPMIAVSGIGSILEAQETVALLILPTFLSNVWQSMRQGLAAAGGTARRFWRLNLVLVLVIGLVAQAVPHLPSAALFAALGATVTAAAAIQLAGWRPRAPVAPGGRRALELGAGLIGGIMGGLAGVWGPAVVLFLVALGTEKTEQIRAQGLSFLLGSVVLVAAHLQSGILNAQTLPLSAALCLPVMAGMALGLKAQDRMAQATFRRITLVVLCLAGLNLLRRALF